MRTGRPKQALILTAEEQDRLQSLAHRARSQPLLARRARVVLACGAGLDNKTVARKVRASLGMVGKWRSRFLQARLEGLYDEPRPGAPRQVSDAQVEQVVIQTLESTPRGETHWSTRGLAKATGLSRMTISRIWRAFGLQPHRTDTFKRSPDDLNRDDYTAQTRTNKQRRLASGVYDARVRRLGRSGLRLLGGLK